MPELTTAQLRLHPLTVEEARALHAGEPVPGWIYADEYPLPDTRDGVGFLTRHGVEDYGFYFLVRREDDVVIGEIGFVGPPDEGRVVIGYAVVPSARRQGYATEAIEALSAWALAQPGVNEVHAQTLPDNEPSVRALLRAGFAEVEATEKMRRFVLANGG